jgi:hypothetical protein
VANFSVVHPRHAGHAFLDTRVDIFELFLEQFKLD